MNSENFDKLLEKQEQKISYKTQPEHETDFEEYSRLPLREKSLICNENYRLNANETTIYKVLGIEGERALLQRTIDPALGNDPTPYVIAEKPAVSKQGFISWDSGDYRTELPTEIKLQVYTKNSETAQEWDELEILFASNELNRICAAEIETAISNACKYSDTPGVNHYDYESALSEVTEKFGAERVNTVLATTINLAEWERRYSDTNKEWAKNIVMPCVEYRSCCNVKTHPVILDNFISYARKAQELSAIEMPKKDKVTAKQSISEKLRKKPAKTTDKPFKKSKSMDR